MSDNQNSELKDDFIIKHIKMIGELYEGEKFLNEKILGNKIKQKKENFVLFDKEWLEKWKTIVDYEILKEKCIKCKKDEDIKKMINEVRELFIKNNTKQNLEKLGKMDGSKLKKDSKKSTEIDEKSNFIPILANNCAYFIKHINGPISINSEISNGIIFIHDPLPIKNKEQKLILFYKENEQNLDFQGRIITLEPQAKIKDIIKDLSKKNIKEIIEQKDLKIEEFKPNNSFANLKAAEAEKKRKELEEAEKKRKELEEAEKKRKELEEAEKKRKEAEEAEKKRKELEEAEKKRKELEEAEKKRKELEEAEKKRKELEEAEKKKKEAEEAEKKRKELEEAEKKRKEAEEAEKKRKEAEEAEKKKKEAEEAEQKKKEAEELKIKEEEKKEKGIRG